MSMFSDLLASRNFVIFVVVLMLLGMSFSIWRLTMGKEEIIPSRWNIWIKGYQVAALLLGAFAAIATSQKVLEVTWRSEEALTIRGTLPVIGIFVILFSISLAIWKTPRNLSVATGACLGFLGASVAYDGWIWAKTEIEALAHDESVLDQTENGREGRSDQ